MTKRERLEPGSDMGCVLRARRADKHQGGM